MERRGYLQIPGPTNIPPRILQALAIQPVNHRGDEFAALLDKCVKGLKKIFKTENDILFYPSSGSGTLESSIVNLFSQGDTVLVSSMGVFSERIGLIAESYGIEVIRISKTWGESVKEEDIRAILEDDKEQKIKGVCLPQNETTTGVVNDIESISKMMKEINHPALLMIDAVSSLASVPLETDKWGLDIVVTASQKGLMLPPGMGIVAVSERAWEAIEKSTLPKWYWNYKAVRERMKIGQFPYTPATGLFFGLGEAIDIIEEEGLENVWARHERMAQATREGIKAMGLELLAEEGAESDTVTAILMPEGINFKEFSGLIKSKYGVVLGGGLQQLQGKIFRIGHMGAINELEIYAIIGAVEMALVELGYKVELGTGAKAVAEVFLG